MPPVSLVPSTGQESHNEIASSPSVATISETNVLGDNVLSQEQHAQHPHIHNTSNADGSVRSEASSWAMLASSSNNSSAFSLVPNSADDGSSNNSNDNNNNNNNNNNGRNNHSRAPGAVGAGAGGAGVEGGVAVPAGAVEEASDDFKSTMSSDSLLFISQVSKWESE